MIKWFMKKIIPPKLKENDEIRIIAPSRSLSLISQESQDIAQGRFNSMKLRLTFGKKVKESDDFCSSSIESRVEDLHQAFTDKKVKAILTVIGGYNSNQILSYLDWELIRKNPKIFCGYSDISALTNAIFAKTGLITYSGLHYSSFGQKLYFDYSLDYFKKCLYTNDPFKLNASIRWSDDPWYVNQDNRTQIVNNGYWGINQGEAEGTILGANLSTFKLLHGTEFMPDLTGSLMFIEDDATSTPAIFDANLQSLIHQPSFKGVKGIVIGRFQKESAMTLSLLQQIVKTKKELLTLPVIANVDFGHTDPKITFPIGGTSRISCQSEKTSIEIIQH
jgi:muramoyltetrapeptide carboxypeptidase